LAVTPQTLLCKHSPAAPPASTAEDALVVRLLQLRIAGTQDQQELAALQRQIVEAQLAGAEQFPGFVRVDRLNAAAVVARDYGLEGLFGSARVRMQPITPNQLGMQSFHFEFLSGETRPRTSSSGP
jgi:hypothetical protein